MTSDDYGKLLEKKDGFEIRDQICFGISFDPKVDNQYTYNIHYNNTQNEDLYDIYPADFVQVVPFKKESLDDARENISSGLLFL